MPVTPFYESERSFRNPRALGLLFFGLLISVFPTLAMVLGSPPGHYSGGPYIFACIIAPLFLMLLATGVHHVIFDVRIPSRIDEMGVTSRGRTHPWPSITMIRFSRGTFSSRGQIAYSIHPRPGVSYPLPRNRPLTPAEYLDIIHRMKPWLASHHPHVFLQTPKTRQER